MPGFQVNSKGEITTQGEKVNKVLVDGEEFLVMILPWSPKI
jgi:hypothetical protein